MKLKAKRAVRVYEITNLKKSTTKISNNNDDCQRLDAKFATKLFGLKQLFWCGCVQVYICLASGPLYVCELNYAALDSVCIGVPTSRRVVQAKSCLRIETSFEY